MRDQHIGALVVTYVRVKIDRGDWWGETVGRYRRCLFDFAAKLPSAIAADPRRVKRHHVQAWVDAPGPRRGQSLAYRRTRLSAVRGFFRWCHAEGLITLDPTIGAYVPDIPESAPRSFSDEDVETLFDAARRDPRDLLCVSLAWNEGLRRIEIARLLIEDVRERTATMEVRGKFYRGDVSRTVAVSPETMAAMSAYLASEPARCGPLVRSRVKPGAAIGAHAVGKIIGDVIADAGLKRFPGDGRSSHAGRHTSATQALEAGASTEHMKRQYGWKSDVMINRYAKAAALDLHVIHELRAQRRDLVKGTRVTV